MVTGARFHRLLLPLLAGAVFAAGCGTDEYTARAARGDLVRLGYSQQQADCVIDGLTERFAQQYTQLNQQQQVDRVNPKAVALYVRNVFASQDAAHAVDVEFTRQLVRRCTG